MIKVIRIVKYVIFKGVVTDEPFLEFVFLHLHISLVGRPAVMRLSVDRRHLAGAVSPALAVNKYRLIDRIINNL